MSKPELFIIFRSMQKLIKNKQFSDLEELLEDAVLMIADADWKAKQEKKSNEKKG